MMPNSKSEPTVFWFTGLSGSGKTTLARKLHAYFSRHKTRSIVIDGDEIRKTISKDLGFSKKDIAENHRRIAALIALELKRGRHVIVSTISPHRSVRNAARKRFKNFIEIYCDCPLAVCAARDPKGHYKNARGGKVKNFIGIHTRYEKPLHPEIILHTDKEKPAESLKKIGMFIKHRQRANFV